MVENLILIYACFFIFVIVIAFLLNALFLRFARTLGIRNYEENIVRWAGTQKPALGGITFYVIFLLSTASYSVFFPQSTVLLNKQLLGMLASVTMAFIMGLADDAYNTKPLLKLFVQIACGFVLVASGTYIRLFGVHVTGHEFWNITITILWVVGIMNSINMLDNMDAIATCITIFILLEAIFEIYVNHDLGNVHALIILGVIGALIGFLFFNWHPSKLFMGDTGSQFLGIILAVFGIVYFWNTPLYRSEYMTQAEWSGNTLLATAPEAQPVIISKQLITVLLAFIIPVSDTTAVVVGRLLRRQSPFVGGKDHTTHHLSYLGLSDSQVAIAFSGISLISFVLIFVVQHVITAWTHIHTAIFGGYVLLMMGLLFYVTRLNRDRHVKKH